MSAPAGSDCDLAECKKHCACSKIVVLTMLAALYILHWASPIVIPVLVGVMTSCALSPLVTAMERLHVHRAVGAAVLLLGLVAGAGWPIR